MKSGNLLVDQHGCVKVADFGLSRLYHGMHTMTGGLGTFQVRQEVSTVTGGLVMSQTAVRIISRYTALVLATHMRSKSSLLDPVRAKPVS